MKITIVILNYNGQKLLKKFLPSVVSYSKGFEIYVADNGSHDNSIEFITKNFNQIKIIKLKHNYGYAEGYNRALKKIKSDVFCLLNSDVRVTKNWIKPIESLFNEFSDVAVIQPKILDENNNVKFEYSGAAGGFIDQLGYPYCRGRILNTIEKDQLQYEKNRLIFWASGACLFVRSDVFKNLNGFDKNFHSYMEEIDFCWRLQNMNLKVLYSFQSKVYHLGSQNYKFSNPHRIFLNFRNNLITITKNTPNPLFLVIILRLLLDGIAGLKFILQGKIKNATAIIKAHLNYYRLLPYALKFRRNNKNRQHYKGEYSILWKYYVEKIKTFEKLKAH